MLAGGWIQSVDLKLFLGLFRQVVQD